MLTLLIVYFGFFLLTLLVVSFFLPQSLVDGWLADPASNTAVSLTNFKLSLFVAALGILAGSLGGRADSKEVVRGVLFVDEET